MLVVAFGFIDRDLVVVLEVLISGRVSGLVVSVLKVFSGLEVGLVITCWEIFC